MNRSVFYALIPLAILLAAASLACFASYFVVLGLGDQFPLRKVITKITLLLLVLSIFPAMKWLKLKKEDLGFAPPKIFFKQLLQGVGLGLATLLPIFGILYVLEINVIDPSKNWTIAYAAQKLSASLALALLISLVEESLFRGILLTGLAKKLKIGAAIMTSSVYYAALHFAHSTGKVPFQDINLFSGFPLMVDAFANIVKPANYSAFLSLLMVGIFLCLIRTSIKTSLGLCIGCHAAWVWQIKMSKSIFNTNPDSDYLFLVSAYDGVIGMLVTVWLMLVIALYLIQRRFEGASERNKLADYFSLSRLRFKKK